MARGFDLSSINQAVTQHVENTLQKGNITFSQPSTAETQPVNEYEGRMKASGIDKFNVPAFVGVVNFYLNAGDQQKHRAKGVLVAYVNIEIADKVYKGYGMDVPYDEDDETMLKLCGQLAADIAKVIKERITSAGYVDLVLSDALVYKNGVSAGVEFSPDQKERQEISFYILKQKALVLDISMAELPRR